ncbi:MULTISPECIES: hypothetical protein [Thiorhodovibrio]|uniref:hypothetical protein n=1 Tax=Thiorhodovibrio TaxID=61593 RepID=UPI0019112B8A|nr:MULTISPECIES: hypothetical protein [Thiorhodovibrio]WPL11267.1 hypothetical protein Thiosp_00999 [Thiorhodovibrio litoralis]
MRTIQRVLGAICLASSVYLIAVGSAYAENCTAIHFEPGHDAATVTGTAPADGQLCYTLATGTDQQAKVAVEGRNMMFSIVDVVDAQDDYSFTTTKKTYRILVGQLMRAIAEEPFTLKVSVR